MSDSFGVPPSSGQHFLVRIKAKDFDPRKRGTPNRECRLTCRGAAVTIRGMSAPAYDILKDDLSKFHQQGPAFVTFGEVMVRDTPADLERPERTRLVHLSMAGSEYSLAIGLARLGIPSAYVTRVPDNPYGQAVRNIARENGVNTDHFVWAPKTEPIGRMIYEIGRTPRRSVTVYQRKYSAASKLDAGMVHWKDALKNARLFHTSGITFGLAAHSNYDRNYCYEAFKEAVAQRPEGCLVGLDFNYRSALWTVEQARSDDADCGRPRRRTGHDARQHGRALRHRLRPVFRPADPRRRDRAAWKTTICGMFAQQVHETVQDHNRRRHDPLSGFVRAAPLGVGGGPCGRHVLPFAGGASRSPSCDRLGGGDVWTAGFYYGLLTEDFRPQRSCQRGARRRRRHAAEANTDVRPADHRQK